MHDKLCIFNVPLTLYEKCLVVANSATVIGIPAAKQLSHWVPASLTKENNARKHDRNMIFVSAKIDIVGMDATNCLFWSYLHANLVLEITISSFETQLF